MIPVIKTSHEFVLDLHTLAFVHNPTDDSLVVVKVLEFVIRRTAENTLAAWPGNTIFQFNLNKEEEVIARAKPPAFKLPFGLEMPKVQRTAGKKKRKADSSCSDDVHEDWVWQNHLRVTQQ